ncbi:unnamed protein product [Gongylonema pulchrum]|uniref:VWFA domain-containing protein n=1 Tax=Gongylonema pulchrum TaxID=637853 RepID=A0A183EZ72_9BILA|nr:unnamed protein product [Gongylonema pulchrum]
MSSRTVVKTAPNRQSSTGNLDLLFAIDRSTDLPIDLTNQLKLATELVDELTDEDISEGRIRVAIISFAQNARMDLKWDDATNKADIFNKLSSIEYADGNSSTVAGIKLVTEYAQTARRAGVRLMIILVSDGNSQDLWHSVTETAK